MAKKGEGSEGTLLDWACRLCPESPRKRIKEWIAGGRFYLHGEVVTNAGLRMEDPGGNLTFGKPDHTVAAWSEQKRIHPKLRVLFLDASLAVVDKGPGLLSVPSEGSRDPSVLDLLAGYLNDPKGEGLRSRLFGSRDPVGVLPVHRLDQYTSGLMCVALNSQSRQVLIDQLRSGKLLREYTALVYGMPSVPEGTWRHFLKLVDGEYRQSLHQQPVQGSVEAVTHYFCEASFERHRVSRLRLRLETGLKHQIRIQAAAEGLPLLGDRLYHEGTRKAVERKGGTLPFGLRRQALHASAIGLEHPLTREKLRFQSRLPKDLASLEDRLR